MKKKKENKFIKQILHFVFIFLVICIWILLMITLIKTIFFPVRIDKSLLVSYDLNKDLIPDPVQKNIKKESIFTKFNGVKYRIDKLATYDITGRVESIKDYNTSKIASMLSFTPKGSAGINMMSPRDLSLSWGFIASNEENGHAISDQYEGGKRYTMFKFDKYLLSKYPKDEIVSHISNNHIITLDSNNKNILLKIKENQIVRIIGWLVYVEGDDGTTWGPSSMVRDDLDMHSCEIILADKIVIMP